MKMIIDGRRPIAPPPPKPPALAPVRKAAAGVYTTTDDAWQIRHADHASAPVPWAATLVATGQTIYRRTLTDCQAAIASGDAQAELADADAAALAQPCRGCHAPAAALLDTINGPQPVCATCRPRLQQAGRTVRDAATAPTCDICRQPCAPDETAECRRCHIAHDHTVNRSTDL